MRILLLINFILGFAFNSIAQQRELEFQNFTQGNGLPSNECYFIYRDSKNFLWIATDQGVVRYNGNNMERFELPDNVVFKIREDDKGRIWFFSHTGRLSYFFNGTVYPYKFNNLISAIFKSILIIDGYVDNNDNVVLAGKYKYQNCRISGSGKIEITQNTVNAYKDSMIYLVSPFPKDNLFTQQTGFSLIKPDTVFIKFKTGNEEMLYSIPCKTGATNQFGCITMNKKDLFFFTNDKIIKICADGSYKVKQFPANILCLSAGKDNKMWVGMIKHGCILLNTDLEEIQNTQLLEDKSISSITSDYEGGTWFSTLEKGVYYLKSIHVYNLNGDSILNQPVFRLCNLADSAFLFANKEGVYKFSNNTSSAVYKMKNERIIDLFTDDDNNIYFAGKLSIKPVYLGEIRRQNDNPGKKIAIMHTSTEVAMLSKNKYLFGQGVMLDRADFTNTSINNINNDFLHADVTILNINPGIIFCDLKKQAWMGSISGLYKLNEKHDILIPFKDTSTFFQKGISAMRQMENGLYTIGIRFGGIVLMEDSVIIGNITESNGLLSNSIKYLMPLKDQLWAATAKGISVVQFRSYHPLKYTITNIGNNEGFYNNIIYQLMPFQENILAATSNGIYVFEDPAQFLNRIQPPIPLYINSVNYYKGDTTNISDITVPFKNNRLKIKYSAISYNSGDEIKYYYRLDDNGSWHTINATELLLENLSPGKYHLELKADIPSQQRFSDIQKLTITIEKPWWQNNWLRFGALLFVALLTYTLYRNRLIKIKKRERQKAIDRTTMIELEQTALRSQMNPHFIFNCLTSIQQLIVTGKSTQANEYLVRFARLIRKTLELSTRPYIKIADEKDYLTEYLILEELRITDQFNFSIEMDNNIDIHKTEIPNMMLQPIVENAIRHGIKHLENKKGNIIISFKRSEGYIICSVTDNGVGRNEIKDSKNLFSEQKSFGMEIIRKRLELQPGNKEGDFFIEIKDLQDSEGNVLGTQVIIQLPYKST